MRVPSRRLGLGAKEYISQCVWPKKMYIRSFKDDENSL